MNMDAREKQEHELREEGKKRSRAFLVGVYMNNSKKDICIEHLDELELLAETYGVEVIHREAIHLRKLDPGTLLTKGKLEEIHSAVIGADVDLVIFDDEILPSQQRNLEALFKLTVMDRTELILEVFGQRAQTKEARLQVDLAKVHYQYPRLKRMWTHLERQAGGGLFVKGMGEKQIEIDKRLLQKKQQKLEKELKEVRLHRDTQRRSRERSGIPTFAIVGYTNAGKSTLLRSLTESEVFVEDKLFATLDTTTRKFSLGDNYEILLIDTVGFIRKLPHTLVAAFRGTLEEAVQADILLHLVDVSHPMAEEHIEATFEVFKELKAEDKPIITVFNKIDQCETLSMVNRLRLQHPHTVKISALTGEGFDDLLGMMLDELRKRRKYMKLRIPQSEYEVVSKIQRNGNVLDQDYEDNDVVINAEVPVEMVESLQKYELV